MKRTFRMAIILIPVAVLLTGIGLWRHHYFKIMNAEPQKVYNKPGQPSNLTTDANTPKVKLVKGDDNTEITDIEPSITTQRIDNSITAEEMDNTNNSPAGTIFGDIAEQNLPPEAAAALKLYEEIQTAYPGIMGELKPLLEATPLDWDAIGLVNKKMTQLQQQRMDALEILAQYSDEAFNELQATIERRKVAESMVAELDEPTSAEDRIAQEEMDAKSKKTHEKLDELYKSIPTMSREELEQASEELKQLSEELSN